MTNLPWDIDLKELENHTPLESIKIINDFEAVGYGIDIIDPKDIICIHEGTKQQEKKYNKVVIRF